MRSTMLSGTAAIALAALLSVAPGVAGADTATTTDTQTQTTTETQADTSGTTSETEVKTEAEADAQKGIDAADLMGDTVENSAGETLGDIETLVVADDGSIEHVVLGVGGFLGIGEKEVAVSWDRFTAVPAENKLVADLTREELEAMPDFEWPDNYQTGSLISPVSTQDTAAQDTSADASETAMTTEQTASNETAVSDTEAAAEAQAELQPLDSMLAGDVIGAEIVAANGEKIGEVDDVVLAADGTAQGVVTEVGGFLGIDEKQVMISWSDLDPKQDADGDLVLQVGLDAEALKALPNYDNQASN